MKIITFALLALCGLVVVSAQAEDCFDFDILHFCPSASSPSFLVRFKEIQSNATFLLSRVAELAPDGSTPVAGKDYSFLTGYTLQNATSPIGGDKYIYQFSQQGGAGPVATLTLFTYFFESSATVTVYGFDQKFPAQSLKFAFQLNDWAFDSTNNYLLVEFRLATTFNLSEVVAVYADDGVNIAQLIFQETTYGVNVSLNLLPDYVLLDVNTGEESTPIDMVSRTWTPATGTLSFVFYYYDATMYNLFMDPDFGVLLGDGGGGSDNKNDFNTALGSDFYIYTIVVSVAIVAVITTAIIVCCCCKKKDPLLTSTNSRRDSSPPPPPESQPAEVRE